MFLTFFLAPVGNFDISSITLEENNLFLPTSPSNSDADEYRNDENSYSKSQADSETSEKVVNIQLNGQAPKSSDLSLKSKDNSQVGSSTPSRLDSYFWRDLTTNSHKDEEGKAPKITHKID